MIRSLSAAAVLLAVGTVLSAAGHASARQQVEAHKGVPDYWIQSGVPTADRLMTLTVAVKQNEEGKRTLQSELLRRSDPFDQEHYGKWFSASEIDALMAPAPAHVRAVRTWLSLFGTPRSTRTGEFMSVTVTVREAEQLLGNVSFYEFTHAKDETLKILRLGVAYTLPDSVADAVDFVGPSVRFPSGHGLRVRSHGSRTASEHRRRRLLFGPIGDSVNPAFLRKLYNATDAAGAPGTKNIQACSSFLNQYYNPSDLAKFFKKYASDAKVTTPTHMYGPNDASNPGIEAELDTQYIMGVGRDVPTQFWSTHGQQPGNPENEPFLVWLGNLANLTDANMPLAMSVSYGDNEPGVVNSYADRVNVEFQKAGARGMSIMFSSGDGGVSGGQSQQCTKFVPTFPAGSPWVTAVGGTTSSNPEVCARFSSGGFSNYFAPQDFQVDAIKGYLSQSGLPSSVLFNSSGAGIPDVAAQGENFDVIVNGLTEPVDGTSCSSPTFTGIVGLLNEARLAAGKSSLGFLNQFIYKVAGPQGAFNDVTKGSNPGCGTEGFPAKKGWDPVTGFGTPNFGKLRDLVLQLP